MPEPAGHPFQYALLRLVPRVERGERLNVGVVLFCRQLRMYLALRWALPEERVRAVAPDLDLDAVRRQLQTLEHVAAGDPAGGALAMLEPSERFGWLVAPSSTIIQPSEVHTGICTDPPGQLERLFQTLVA